MGNQFQVGIGLGDVLQAGALFDEICRVDIFGFASGHVQAVAAVSCAVSGSVGQRVNCGTCAVEVGVDIPGAEHPVKLVLEC